MDDELERYHPQMVFAELCRQGQRALRKSCTAIVGVGGLGTWVAELLARAGVGTLRLIDGDTVELTNLHRQGLFSTADAEMRRAKVSAAEMRLRDINPQVRVEARFERMDSRSAHRLLGGADLVLDGLDNYLGRYIVNDYCVRRGVPWVFAGVLGAQGQVMPVLPGRTACLRCVMPSPPPPCAEPTCRTAGILGPAVAAIAAIEALEAIKILAGKEAVASRRLLKVDFWTGEVSGIDSSDPVDGCPCCVRHEFEYCGEQ
jgi:adenylyltransferase/sulfurtransferase